MHCIEKYNPEYHIGNCENKTISWLARRQAEILDIYNFFHKKMKKKWGESSHYY